MANVSRVNGFRPVKYLNGAPWNGQANHYEIAAGDATATMVGDLVMLSDLAPTEDYIAVERAGTTGAVTSNALVGVIVGFVALATDLNTPQYRAASVKRIALVADDPNLLFESEEDAVGGTLAIASLGLNLGYMATAGNTTTGNSGMVVDSSSAATTSTLPLQFMGFSKRVDNERAVANAKVLVRINTHAFGNVGVAGV